MKNLTNVEILRSQLQDRTSGIKKKEGGVYCWWFKREVAQTLLKELPLTQDELSKIQTKEIGGEEYLALYFGISKDMLGRAKWHIAQKHTASAVKYGTVSTLRNSLGALLGKDMSESEGDVNDLMDKNCYWEWEYATDYKNRETNELSSPDKCYPLNIQENKTVSKEMLKKLSQLRSQHKK
jgi:hypothetical protein